MLYVLGGVIGVSIFALLYFMRKDNYRLGQQEAQQKQAEEVIDDVHVVVQARDVIAGNRSMRDKLRDKYTRK